MWDELCLICGICPDGGPRKLFYDLEETLEKIIKDIQEQNLSLNIDEKELREEFRNLLVLFGDPKGLGDETDYEKAIKEGIISSGAWFPFNYDWDGWKAIAIGIFDDTDEDISDVNHDTENLKV
jgi:hypothetical protein